MRPPGREDLGRSTTAGLARLVELGHELGNHGRTHRRFVELSADEVLRETPGVRAEIRRFGAPSPVVAPPRGAVNREVIETLNAKGLTVRLAPSSAGDVPGRDHVADGTALSAQRARHLPSPAAPPHAAGDPVLRAWSRSRSMRERLLAIADAAADSGTSIHVWGHSEEIDRLGIWRDLSSSWRRRNERGFAPATNGELVRAGAGTR